MATGTTRPIETGMNGGTVRARLRLEGLAAFGVGLMVYAINSGEWLSANPALLPDLSAIG